VHFSPHPPPQLLLDYRDGQFPLRPNGASLPSHFNRHRRKIFIFLQTVPCAPHDILILQRTGLLGDYIMENLGSCPELEEIEVADCLSLTDLRALEKCPRLRKISVMGCKNLRTLDGITTLEDLVELNVAHCKLSSTTPATSIYTKS